ncbi:hypothetical protein AB0A05_38065 [Streptomyces sp. NPDC046374]|uniref:hypothetical protein n=1 Tax=Streptomyces sp. NPDC046374 TaxID=3154917 RepID=UPI0033D0260A
MIETIITAETPRDTIGYTLDDHVEADRSIFGSEGSTRVAWLSVAPAGAFLSGGQDTE